MVNATLHKESISGRALQILVTIPMVSIMIIEMTKKKNPYIQSLLVRQDGERLPASFRKENQIVGLTKDNGSLGRKQWQDSPCFYNPQT